MSEDYSFKENIVRAIDHLKTIGFESAYINVMVRDKHCLGCICTSHDANQQVQFYNAIDEVMKSW